jgi:hypothetical protein
MTKFRHCIPPCRDETSDLIAEKGCDGIQTFQIISQDIDKASQEPQLFRMAMPFCRLRGIFSGAFVYLKISAIVERKLHQKGEADGNPLDR